MSTNGLEVFQIGRSPFETRGRDGKERAFLQPARGLPQAAVLVDSKIVVVVV